MIKNSRLFSRFVCSFWRLERPHCLHLHCQVEYVPWRWRQYAATKHR